MVKVLFVCLGNICRSPTAEGVFRDLVQKDGLSDQISTDSCGTGSWHVGGPPDERATQEAWARGIKLDDLRARQITQSDFETFDFILAMDDSNYRNLAAMCPAVHRAKISLFLEFAPGVGRRDVPDPYYGGDDGFRHVFDMIDQASHGLLEHIRQDHLSAD